MNFRVATVCSGIDAPEEAWKDLGWEFVWRSEIDPMCNAVSACRHPGIPNLGDMTTIGEQHAPVDLLCGGTPCQSFSVAGLRGGLDDPRGNLALEFLRIAHATRAEWLVWENVPGVLSSSGGRDFGAFLGGLAELRYGFAWRILDAQFFGVPQRRRRVFVVARLGDWRGPAAVLLEHDCLRRNPAPGRETREAVASIFAGGSGERGYSVGPAGGEETDTACTLDARAKDGAIRNQIGMLVTGAVSSKWAKGSGGPAGDECYNLVVHPLSAEGHDASEDGTGRGTPLYYTQNTCDEVRLMGDDGQSVGALPAERGMKQQPYVFSRGNMGRAAGAEPSDEVCPSLRAEMEDHSPTLATCSAVRRLTPRECERLQGFPDVAKCGLIRVCPNNSSDPAMNPAPAAILSPRSPKSAYSADANVHWAPARFAASHSSTNLPGCGLPVVVNVGIDCETGRMQLSTQGRLLSPVSTAENRRWFHPPMLTEDFARLAALTLFALEKTVALGGVESLPWLEPSSDLQNGSPLVLLSGYEMRDVAGAVAKNTSDPIRCFMSTISEVGRSSPNYASNLKTCCCFVGSVIASFIPDLTRSESSYDLEVTCFSGYTLTPNPQGKPMSDAARYRMLGNSMAVPVMRWIGERIERVRK